MKWHYTTRERMREKNEYKYASSHPFSTVSTAVATQFRISLAYAVSPLIAIEVKIKFLWRILAK
jgi:hypothetical protein